MNYIEDRGLFADLIRNGQWDQVLDELGHLALSSSAVSEVYEQIFYEMLEVNELDAARALLRQSTSLRHLKESQTEKYLLLENVLSQTVLTGEFPSRLKESKLNRRERLSQLILKSVADVPSGRLLTLIDSALKWEEQKGSVSPNSSFDIFHGSLPNNASVSEMDKFPRHRYNSVKLEQGSHVECAVFSPNGQYFVLGMADGFLEVWDSIACKLRTDLPFQTDESDMMRISKTVTALVFSPDSELLAVGSVEGEVAVFRISTGKLLKSFSKIHEKGITNLAFSPDSSSLLSCGFDNEIRLLGLKQGRVLKEFRGHQSYVNSVLWVDSNEIISASHDGTLKVWSVSRAECLSSSLPPGENSLSPPPIRAIIPFTATETDFLYIAVTQSTKLHVFSQNQRKFSFSFPSRSKSSASFLAATLGTEIIFALLDDGHLMGFKRNGPDFNTALGNERISSVEPIGMALHPKFNVLVTYNVNGDVDFWRP